MSFLRGGQGDIIEDRVTGYLAEFNEDIYVRARNLADGIVWAITIIEDPEKHCEIVKRMRKNVEDRFSYHSVAQKYISLINDLKQA